MNKAKLKQLVKEVYYGSIPPEPETPAGYGGAMDRAKVQQHLSDVIDDLVRLGKLNIDGLSIETVRANQEIPWDKFQAIDDEVLGDLIRDYKRRQRFYKEGTESKLKQIIREELQVVLKEGFVSATGDTPEDVADVVRRWMADENIDSNDEQTIAEKITDIAFDSGVLDDDIPDWQDAVFDILVDTGSNPEELKASGDYPDVISENKRHLKQIIREELTMMTNEDDPFEFYRDLYKDLYGRSPYEYPSEENLRAEIETLTFIQDTNNEQDKYWAEMDAVEAMPPDAGTETPLPPKFSGMGRRIKESKRIRQLVKETMESALNERDYDWARRSNRRKWYGKPEEALEEIKRLVDEIFTLINNPTEEIE